MSDPVLRVLTQRQSLIDDGYSKSVLLSGAVHATTFFVLLILTFLTPKPKLINVIDGFAMPLPRGGGMPKAVEAAPVARDAAPPAPVVATKEPPVESAPVRLIKPETAVVKKGIAPVDLKKSVKQPKNIESREVAQQKIAAATQAPKPAQAPTPGAASTATGLDFSATTAGVVDGVDGLTGAMGFYLAAAKGRIWMNWNRQLRPDFSGVVTVAFVIHRDGSIDGVEILESSGSNAVDRLAERAVLSTQLGPMPNSYDKETIAIHATFKPVS